MTLLREHVAAVRALLDGETVTVDGRYVQLDNVALDWPPTRRPTAADRRPWPKTIELAGELADGVLLDSVTDASVVRRARDLLDAARSQVGPPRPRTRVRLHRARDEQAAGRPRRPDLHLDGRARAAGADTVILQAPHDQPDPSALVEALGLTGSGTPERPR